MMFARSAARFTPRICKLYSSRGYADQMDLTFVSQNKVFYHNADVRQVDVPSFSGSFGILPSHVPSLAVLKSGVITVHEHSGEAKKIFVSSGSVTINQDSSVQILAEEAVDVSFIDTSMTRDLLTRSQVAAASASSEEAKAEALIAVEVAEELLRAAEA